MKRRLRFSEFLSLALLALLGSAVHPSAARADDSGFDQSIYSDPLSMNQPMRSFAGTPYVPAAYYVMTPYGPTLVGQMPNTPPAAPDPAYVANAIMWNGTVPLGANYLPPMGMQYFQNRAMLGQYERYLDSTGAAAAN